MILKAIVKYYFGRNRKDSNDFCEPFTGGGIIFLKYLRKQVYSQ
jgi:site-specific DNA-adenine methylase